MAIRNVLHMSQLKAFEEFLESKGYLIIPTVGRKIENLRRAL